MERPTELHLLPDEMYPGERTIEDSTPQATIIKNMSQMADFVFKFYMQKVETLKIAMVSSFIWRVYSCTVSVVPKLRP